MSYLIDGHNMLGQIPGLTLSNPADRQRLVGMLSSFAKARRGRITLYFDGEPPDGWRAEMSFGGVRVVHSGRGRSADDALLEAIRRSRTPADITLVTSDRSLYERARHLGAKAMAGHAFRELMGRQEGRRAPGVEKPERPAPGEVDYFLSVFLDAPPPASAPVVPSVTAGRVKRSRRRR